VIGAGLVCPNSVQGAKERTKKAANLCTAAVSTTTMGDFLMRHKTDFTATRALATTARWGVGCAAVAVLFLVGSANARAQEKSEYHGTQDQQVACTGDVFRLCWSEIPNVSRIVDCLVREKPRLSTGCRAVFEQDSRIASARWHGNHRRIASATERPQPAGHDRREETAAANSIQVASATPPVASTPPATSPSNHLLSRAAFHRSHVRIHLGRFHRTSHLVRHLRVTEKPSVPRS
jgi:hypothetical protein